MKPFRYRVVVEWSDEDDVFLARVPALSGCVAHGRTQEAAAREARRAAEAILHVLREDRQPMPPEDISANYSGQIRLRVPRSLHARLARLASTEGVSLNQMMVALLAQGASGETTLARAHRTERRE